MSKHRSLLWLSVRLVFLVGSCPIANSLCASNPCFGSSYPKTNGSEETSHREQPNIILIISDDQAWTDYGFMGHPTIQTPNIDRLANESLTFSRGYVPTSLCCPSLASIITGLYPSQHQVTGNDPTYSGDAKPEDRKNDPEFQKLEAEFNSKLKSVPTLPRLLAKKGYLSHQSGKWWQGSFADGGFTHGMTHGDPQRGGRHGDEGLKIGRLGLQPIFDFIEQADSKPFFVWYAPFLPHTPHNPPQRLLDKYKQAGRPIELAKYYAMCEWFDETCGQLIDHIDDKGLAENTLIVFVTDNGWIQMTADTKRPDNWKKKFAPGSKQSPSDKGIRTPIMLRWKGKLQPNFDSVSLVSSIDLAPTILAAAGIDKSESMTGVNLLVVTKENPLDRDIVYGEIFAHDIANLSSPTESLLYRWCIAGEQKLVVHHDGKTGRYGSIHKHMHGDKLPDLFSILEDPYEESNLYKQGSEQIGRLTKRIQNFFGQLPQGK